MKKKPLMTALKVTGGVVAANALQKIPFVAANPIVGAAAPIVLAMFGGKMFGAEIATGMIVGGTINAVKTLAPSVATTVGLGTPYASYNNPGVAGYHMGQIATHQQREAITINS